jgi:hypothetical protein
MAAAPPSTFTALCPSHWHDAGVYRGCGYLATAVSESADGLVVYLYDQSTTQLVAVLLAANSMGWNCLGGDPSFALDTSCFVRDGWGHCYLPLMDTECDAGSDAGGDH